MARDDWHLKYRPAQLDDLVGQSSVVNTLKQASRIDRFANSYFFVGTKGCGKTSSARILANLLTCENPKDGRLCGECIACRTIPSDVAMDVIELDGAANGKVEHITALIDGARWNPSQLKRKVYIIDECLGYRSRVETKNGLIPIGKIVNDKLNIKVKSYNEDKNEIEWKKISAWHLNSGKDIYSIHLETLGVLHAADNHQVMTPNGWKKVADLDVGDEVCRHGLVLNEFQEQVALGSLMGDASIGKNKPTLKKGSRTNSRLRFVHGYRQLDYLKWKAQLFGNFSRQLTPKVNLLTGFAKQPTSYFNTSVSSQFNRLHELFYKNGVKTITDTVLNKLNAIAMAIWFCDDGSLNRVKVSTGFSNYVTLHTEGFSWEENELIKNWLKDRWDIDSTVQQVKTGLFAISMSKTGSLNFLNLIVDYVPISMKHKLKYFGEDTTDVSESIGFWDSNKTENHEGLIVEKITKKTFFRRESETYDLEIEGNHNYFVSGTLVHNCHRLSGSAVSALLKITEDPPAYLNFIFCTTDPDKVIDTITSRSQRFNFRRLLSKEIVGRLRYISEKESVNITDDALFILAKKSRGSMRDAVVSLEQIAVLAGSKEITGAIAQKYFGMADRQIVFQIIDAIVNSNIPLVMDQVNDLIMSNVDTKEIAFEISEAFRNIMLLKANNGDCKWLDLPEYEVELLKKNGENIKLAQLDKLAKQFSTLRKELEFSINERWVLESTLIHCTALLRKT